MEKNSRYWGGRVFLVECRAEQRCGDERAWRPCAWGAPQVQWGSSRKKDDKKGFICQAKEFELEQEEPKRFSSLEATGFVF